MWQTNCVTEDDNSFKFGRTLSSPPPSEEIVISGVAGAFPSAQDVEVFKTNLFNKVDMTMKSRWNTDHPEVPKKSGVILNAEKFDSGFFGLHHRQAHTTDPTTRMILEKVVECIIDAGLHPSELKDTRTGVFIGASAMETEIKWPTEFTEPNYYTFTGASKFMLSQRISYFLQLKGPTAVTDTACSSSLYALEHAFKAIRLGECDNAIVGGINMCLHPYASVQFARLGVLSPEACCRPFDKQGRGYVRSDSVCAMLLQKAKDAKRIYAQIVHVKTNCDGYKEQGITYPSGLDQEKLLREFYDECGINPLSLSYIEAHGTGTIVGDPEECHTIDRVFATNRKEPLLIGSVKSSIGHSESASGLVSIIKCIIAMETDVIPPNINYDGPRDSIVAIKEGRLEVVTKNMGFRDDRGLIGVNSFGFGGANCHVLLKRKAKQKVDNGIPGDHLPRLVCVSGRTREAVITLLDDISHNKLDAEYIKLLHDVFSKDIGNHLFRGYVIASKSGEICRSLTFTNVNSPQLYLIFGHLSNWRDVATDLNKIHVFAKFLQRIQEISLKNGTNVTKVIEGSPRESHDVLGGVIVQLCIADVIKLLKIQPSKVMGYSFGKLVKAYYEDVVTLEESVRCAYMLDREFYSNGKTIENGVNGTEGINNYHTLNGENSVKENGLEETNKHNKNTRTLILEDKLLNKLIKVLRATGSGKSAERLYENFQSNPLSSFKPPETSVVWEVGSVQEAESTDINSLSFSTFANKDYTVKLLQIIGRLYEMGYSAQISELYPEVKFPVSKGTSMIAPKIKWKHDRDWFLLKFREPVIREQKTFKIDITDSSWSFITGHVIDSRNLFPASGYLFLVWDVFVSIKKIDMTYMDIVFENCKFIRATTVSQDKAFELKVTILISSGLFEVTNGESTIVTGRISLVDNVLEEFAELSPSSSEGEIPLQTKDIYKELRLRGYNYKGPFKSIKEYQVSESKGLIEWDENWVTFIDNMFQTKILQTDTRLLYVPTSIARLTISASTHRTYIDDCVKQEKPPHLPVYYSPEADLIKSGGIEVRGLIASSINRKKYLGTPVLEKYEFVPNNANLSLNQSVRVNMQIILENILSFSLNIAEVIETEPGSDYVFLSTIIESVLGDQPLITSSIKILSKTRLDVNITVEPKSLDADGDYTLIVVSDVFNKPQMLKQALQAIAADGYILTRESKDFDISKLTRSDIVIQTVHRTPTETLVLFIRSPKLKEYSIIKLEELENFSWIPEVQNALKSDQSVILFTQNDPLGGAIGFINCLRKEPGTSNIRCVFMMDQTKPYRNDDDFYNVQLNKNMAINVYKNGEWGTYRHLLLEDSEVESEHSYVNITVKGDLASLRWIEGPLSCDYEDIPERQLVKIYYAALNFKDVMTATGKINADVTTKDRLEQESVLGLEFAGSDRSGRRVMGMVTAGALSTLTLSDSYLLWDVPDSWSLKDAATVPAVYGTVIYALHIRGQMKPGESVLIHSGTGGIGQAAIRLALHHGCTVFTTVGTVEKKEFLKKMYPQLTDKNIGNSHDNSFEQLVMTGTNGRGVDIVLNSLAEDKLQTSVRCLARGGRFLEIGKFDASSNNALDFVSLEKNCSFHGVMLDKLFTAEPEAKSQIGKYLAEYIANGAIQPLGTNVFKFDEIEQAFRFMAAGKHMGKVLIEVKKDEEKMTLPQKETYKAMPRYSCHPKKSYVIIGGLGGFGLELADWLVLRGARNVVLTSRKGIRSGYQEMRIRLWKSYGVSVHISTADVTKEEGCSQLIGEASKLGPVDAVFNLAAVLQDAIFENQTIEKFQESFAPKAIATRYMDQVTRKKCPKLRHFVVFSSVSCGRGNAGQTNYGMANSVMERICEKRRQDGFPALAIEWGAVGEVGLVAEMQEDHKEIAISGTLQQRISSCLQVLDTFLGQNQATIVSSIVVAEKKIGKGCDNIINCVANILGITDLKTVSSMSTLAELGMDSMTAIEIKQTLEREYEAFFTDKDIRSLTFARLKELDEEKQLGVTKQSTPSEEDKPMRLNFDFDLLPAESECNIQQVRMQTALDERMDGRTVIFIPGIEGFSKIFEPLSRQVNAHAVTLQYDYNNQASSILEMAQAHLPLVEDHLKKDGTFFIVAHSYGAVIALELVNILEERGFTGMLLCIDGAPSYLKEFIKTLNEESEDLFQTNFVCRMLSFYITDHVASQYRQALLDCKSLDERLNMSVNIGGDVLPYNGEYQKKLCFGLYKRIKALSTYLPSLSNIKSRVVLCKPSEVSLHRFADDYNLSEICSKPVEIKTYEGDHLTIINNEMLAKDINSLLGKSD